MSSRATFLIQILEKLAAPLMASISEVSVRSMMMPDPGEPGSLRPEAEQVAQLLTKSTEMAISLSGLVDMMEMQDKEADAMRLGMTGVASPLIANLYRLAGRVPSNSEADRIAEALNSIVPYADNFEAAADVAGRLNTLDYDFFPADKHQVTLQYLYVLLPAVNSIMAYSFGQHEQKLAQEVTQKIIKTAKALRLKVFPQLEGAQAAKADLSLLRLCALVYSQCHFSEMAKLMATEDQARQGLAPSMISLWQAYDLRLQMLEVLAAVIVPGGEEQGSGGSASGGGVKPAARQEENKEESNVKPLAAEAKAEAPKQAGGNPMSFFAKKGK